MGRILILEPQPEVRSLLEHVASRLGLDVLTDPGANRSGPSVEIILLEPASPKSLATALSLRARFPDIPVICASIAPPDPVIRQQLGPVAYLTKPFRLAELERTIVAALADARSEPG